MLAGRDVETEPTGDLFTVVTVPRDDDVPVTTFVAVVLLATVLPAEMPLLVLLPVAVTLETALELRALTLRTLEPPLRDTPLPAKTRFDPV